MDHAELKRLKTREAELKEALAAAEKQRAEAAAKVSKSQSELATTRRQIQDLTKHKEGPVVVTEHALLRYLERVKGVDLESIRAELLPPQVEKLARGLGAGLYPVGGTHKVRVKDHVVITVLTDDEDDHGKPAKKRPWARNADDDAPTVNPNIEDHPSNGKLCSVCREAQYETPWGACCKNGHGGADPVDPDGPEPEVAEGAAS